MKLISLNYVRDGILMCVIILFSCILVWSRPQFEGVDATLEDAADAKLDAANKAAELNAKTAAMDADAIIAKANADIAKATTAKTLAADKVDVVRSKSEATAQQDKIDAEQTAENNKALNDTNFA